MTYTCKHCGEPVPALTICNCRGALIEHYLEELDRHGFTRIAELEAELAECQAAFDGVEQ